MKITCSLSDGRKIPSFALAIIAAHYYPKEFLPQKISTESKYRYSVSRFHSFEQGLDTLLTKIKYPADSERAFPINYFGPVNRNHITVLRASEFLMFSHSPAWDEKLLENKIVIIGSTRRLDNKRDTFKTPYGNLRGVEVHANIVNNLLNHHNYLKPIGDIVTFIIFLSFLSVAVLSQFKLRLSIAASTTATLMLIYIIVSCIVFITNNLILPIGYPSKAGFFGFLVTYYLRHNHISSKNEHYN